MVHLIPHEITPGLRKENAIHDDSLAQTTVEHIARHTPTVAAFLADFLKRAEGIQFQRAVAGIPCGSRVLDIGVGEGHTSLYLAAQGYRVVVAEPSLGLCRHVEQVAQLYGLEVEIYNTSAEYLDRLPLRDFAACIFNASLHHCDDPARAVRHCRTLLQPQGRLFVLHEPLLQFFRSKEWFQKKLQDGSLAGDYGGNEHTYYYHEYRDMLRRAGFHAIDDFVSERYVRPQSYLAYLKRENISRRKLWLRVAYYRTLQGMFTAGWVFHPLLSLMKRLSLLQTNFIATK